MLEIPDFPDEIEQIQLSQAEIDAAIIKYKSVKFSLQALDDISRNPMFLRLLVKDTAPKLHQLINKQKDKYFLNILFTRFLNFLYSEVEALEKENTTKKETNDEKK